MAEGKKAFGRPLDDPCELITVSIFEQFLF